MKLSLADVNQTEMTKCQSYYVKNTHPQTEETQKRVKKDT